MGKQCVIRQEETKTGAGECETYEMGNIAINSIDDLVVFAVSATDGMMDYLTSQYISETISSSFVDFEYEKLLKVCESLVVEAAMGWSGKGGYRDDIAIAVSKVEIL